MVESIVETYHVVHHSSWSKMYNTLSKKFYWHNMHVDIQKKCNECPNCIQLKEDLNSTASTFTSLNSSDLFNIISIDVLEMPNKSTCSLTNTKYSHILVVMDMFTRYINLIPVTDLDADKLAFNLYQHITCIYGPPMAILSDNAKVFVGNIHKKWCELSKIKRMYSIPRIATGNAQNERSHRTVLQHLRTILETKHNNWCNVLKSAQYVFNTSVITNIGITPYELMHGRKPRHLSLHQFDKETPLDSVPEFTKAQIEAQFAIVKDMREEISIIFKYVKENAVNKLQTREYAPLNVGDVIAYSMSDRTSKLKTYRAIGKVTEVLENDKYRVHIDNKVFLTARHKLTKLKVLYENSNFFKAPITKEKKVDRLTSTFVNNEYKKYEYIIIKQKATRRLALARVMGKTYVPEDDKYKIEFQYYSPSNIDEQHIINVRNMRFYPTKTFKDDIPINTEIHTHFESLVYERIPSNIHTPQGYNFVVGFEEQEHVESN